jgi:hypothetical protein
MLFNLPTLRTVLISSIALASSATAALHFTSGHGDIGVEYSDGELHLHLHLGHGAPAIVGGVAVVDQEYAADEVAIVVPAHAQMVLGTSLPWLDAPAGGAIWLLPGSGTSSAIMGAPFLGWSTEHLEPSDWIDHLSISLVSAVSSSGTGNFAVWQTDPFGGLSRLAMATAVEGAHGISLISGVHGHYQIAFTEPGVWEIGLSVQGLHVEDGWVTGRETITFMVVPEPSTALFGLLALPLMLARRRSSGRPHHPPAFPATRGSWPPTNSVPSRPTAWETPICLTIWS